MKKPDKFDSFINLIVNESCKSNPQEIFHGFEIEEIESCEEWLDRLIQVKELGMPVNSVSTVYGVSEIVENITSALCDWDDVVSQNEFWDKDLSEYERDALRKVVLICQDYADFLQSQIVRLELPNTKK